MKDTETKEWRYNKDKEKPKNAEELGFVCVMPRQPRDACLTKQEISLPMS